MDLKQLEYFVRVAELGSFTKAAVLLHVAQPALSRQIRHLETDLKVQLLTRNGRGVVATEAGKRLLEHSRGILRQVTLAQEDIEESRGTRIGRVAIGMPATIAAPLTVPLVERFRCDFPKAKLSIMQGRSATLQEWILSGRVDMAILYNAPFSPLIESRPLLTEELALVQAAQRGRKIRAITLSELPQYPLIIPSQPNTMRMLIEQQLARLGLSPTIVTEIDTVPAILELVGKGYGSAVLSPRAVFGAVNRKDLIVRPITNPSLTVQLTLSIPSRRPSMAPQDVALELVREVSLSVLGATAVRKRRAT
jgi:LysR family nitrogen assimilation transcriptional regulator